MNEEYYLRNMNGGYLGNSWFWYGKDGKGYTAYILGAERFSKEEAEKFVKEDPSKWEMYTCSEIDKRLHLIFDSQDVKNLGSDNPCGWSGGYADNPETSKDILEALEKMANTSPFHDKYGEIRVKANEVIKKAKGESNG